MMTCDHNTTLELRGHLPSIPLNKSASDHPRTFILILYGVTLTAAVHFNDLQYWQNKDQAGVLDHSQHLRQIPPIPLLHLPSIPLDKPAPCCIRQNGLFLMVFRRIIGCRLVIYD